jgi:hypothetical protein
MTGKLYDKADEKIGPLKPSMDANLLVAICEPDVFTRKLDDDAHDVNSMELVPKRQAALDTKKPKLEPTIVN